MTIQQLREQRAKAAKALRALVEDHEGDWGGEQEEQYQKGVKEIEEIDAKIDRLQTTLNLDAARDNTINAQAEEQGVSIDEATANSQRHTQILNRWMRGGDNAITQEDWQFMNALSTTTDSEGGFTVPENFQRRLLDTMKLFGGMREVAEVISVSTGETMIWPTTDSADEEGEIIGQNASVADDDNITFGSKNLEFFVWSSKAIPVPRQLLQDNAVDLEAHLLRRLANRIWRLQNKHYTVGDGTNKPSGVVTDATVGVTTTSGQVDDVLFDDLVKLIHSVDPVYRNNAQFMFHDSTLLQLKLKKDGDNRPLWLPGVGVDAPDTIYGEPYSINQSMPVLGAGNKPVAYGDFSHYLIADAVAAEMFRFTDSAYTKKNQVGFLSLMRSGGGLVDVGGAVKTLQNAAS